MNKIIFSKIKTNLGFDNTKYFFTGAAPITMQTLEYFGSINIPILELYGMSETTGVITSSTYDEYKWGSVGRAVIGEVKIADDGEILVKGENVMLGYWNKKQETDEVLVDGWLYTGDIGEIDPEDGYLKINDRKKDIIVSAGGDNI